jgi:Phospholipase_D-nuclease N-terminal
MPRAGLRYAPIMPTLTIEQIVLLLAPVVLIQLGLMIAALIDLEKDERRVRGGRKVVWALIIIFVNILGPILYFTAGREDA